MGILTAIGSSARIIGPLYVTPAFKHFGLQLAFGIIASIILVSLIAVFLWICYVSHKERERKEERRD